MDEESLQYLQILKKQRDQYKNRAISKIDLNKKNFIDMLTNISKEKQQVEKFLEDQKKKNSDLLGQFDDEMNGILDTVYEL